MKDTLKSILKYVGIMFIVFIFICVISVVISRIYEYFISDVFFYASMISFVTAFIFVAGSTKSMSDSHYMRSISSSSGSVNESAKQDMARRNSSLVIMVFMTIIGILLMIISVTLVKHGL